MRRTQLLLILLLTASAARPLAAQPTEGGAAILFFPLIAADSERDTVIRLVNRSTRVTYARCEYRPDGEGGDAVAFDLTLLLGQPTQWSASRGRPVDPADAPCERGNVDCAGAGFDPGRIPPLPEGFSGDLVCVQVDRSRAPTPGNALRGNATLSTADGDIAGYEGIGLRGLAQNDADEVLCLGGGVGEDCPRGPEYAACPQSWLLGLRADGTPQGSGDGAPTIRNTLAVTSCSRGSGEDSALLTLAMTNEFEQRLTASTSVARREAIPLAAFPIFQREVVGTDFMQVRIRPSTTASAGVVLVALTDRGAADQSPAGGAEAMVPYAEGAREASDRIVLGGE